MRFELRTGTWSRPILLMQWQGKVKACPPGQVRLSPHPPTMGFDDRTADRESHAHAARLRRVERVEEAIETLRVQSRTRISHSHENAVRYILRGADQQIARPHAG